MTCLAEGCLSLSAVQKPENMYPAARQGERFLYSSSEEYTVIARKTISEPIMITVLNFEVRGYLHMRKKVFGDKCGKR